MRLQIADCRLLIVIRERGPLTVAAFMDLALYDPEFGYYARAAQRSGRAGDFFTSVDVGPLFGELLEVQIAEMAGLLAAHSQSPSEFRASVFDLVEAGAGNGRLSADILRAARRRDPGVLRSHPPAPGRGERRGARARSARRSATSPIGWPRPAPRCPSRSKAC